MFVKFEDAGQTKKKYVPPNNNNFINNIFQNKICVRARVFF